MTKDKNKSTNKQDTPEFHIVENGSEISAGICGPNGCVLDWSKTEK